MEVKIFDVAHGFCSHIVTDDGKSLLVDCGRNEETRFEPAEYLLARNVEEIDQLCVLNYDEDHVNGLPKLSELISIRSIMLNLSVRVDVLRQLKAKTGPPGAGISILLKLMDSYNQVIDTPQYQNLEVRVFNNIYPEFEDTNNLSIVLFLHCQGLSIVFPGDMEKAGWEKLLEDAYFLTHLSRVNVFIASHHGRENGFVSEVFDFCRPEIIVISDESIKYETQEDKYAAYARGIEFGKGNVRRVLTTRNDGMITITNQPGGRYFVELSKG